MTKKDEIRIGSIIKEVRVKLDPDGVRGPLIKNYKVFFVSGDGVQMEGERIKCLKLDQLGVVQRDPGYPDSFHEIRRFGYCREEDLDTFIEAMLNGHARGSGWIQEKDAIHAGASQSAAGKQEQRID